MQLDFQARELTVKLVYYGPALSGKTTNLQAHPPAASPEGPRAPDDPRDAGRPHAVLRPAAAQLQARRRGLTVASSCSRSPARSIHNATRRLVLQGADGVAFIADSQIAGDRANQARSWTCAAT